MALGLRLDVGAPKRAAACASDDRGLLLLICVACTGIGLDVLIMLVDGLV